MDNKRKAFAILMGLVCLVLAVSFISCSSPKECKSTIQAKGKSFTGIGESLKDAKHFACNKYCLETDPGCEAMYGIWVTSPKGRAAGSPPKAKAIYEEKALLDCVTITCANKCAEEIAAAKIKATTKCN